MVDEDDGNDIDTEEDEVDEEDEENNKAREDAARVAATPTKKVLGINVEDSSRTATPRPA